MKIVYVYDALCGWCYGFSPVMEQFHNEFKDSIRFEVISGGMITGSRIGPVGEVAPYISWAYKEVENKTGVKFGSGFLDKTLKEGTSIFTSIPLAIALSVFKEVEPEQSIQFAAELQKAVYYSGIEPENLNAYGEIAAKFGLDSVLFVQKMKDPKYLSLAKEDFKKSADLKVSGFPTIFLEIDNKHYVLGNGYMPYSTVKERYLTLKNQIL
ncbi:MAG: DsbA family protein [Luteibaculaceae bacterium]